MSWGGLVASGSGGDGDLEHRNDQDGTSDSK